MIVEGYEPRTHYWLSVLAEAGLPSLKPEAQDLIDNGWRPEDWAICVRSAELSLMGKGKGLNKSERTRLYEAPDALRLAILYSVGEVAPPPTYLGTGSGWSWDDNDTAWSPGSGVDAGVDRRVLQRWRPKAPPFQLDLEFLPLQCAPTERVVCYEEGAHLEAQQPSAKTTWW